MSGMHITIEQKRKRLIAFLYDLNEHINNKQKFSFTNKISKYKIVWCTNAMALSAIMQKNDIVKKCGPTIWCYTERGQEFKMKELVDFIIARIDSKENHLANVMNDFDATTIDEKVINYKDIAHLHAVNNKPKIRKNGKQSPAFVIDDQVMVAVPVKLSQERSDDIEARLKDCLVIINVLYEEMITNNLRTNGRQIAGRFLRCNGYEQLVKQVEK